MEYFKNKPLPEKQNPLKNEHLRGEFSPIRVCVGNQEEHLVDYEAKLRMLILVRDAVAVNFGEPARNLDEKGFKNNGEETYVISTIDSKPKKSSGFVNCTGCIVVGVDKETGENISFLSHQDPTYFTDEGGIVFSEDLSESLLELKERSIEGSIDAIVIGGNILDLMHKNKTFTKYYKDSTEFISTLIEKRLGFLPVISTQAKRNPGFDSVLLDTENRRVYLFRESQLGEGDNEPYLYQKESL